MFKDKSFEFMWLTIVIISIVFAHINYQHFFLYLSLLILIGIANSILLAFIKYLVIIQDLWNDQWDCISRNDQNLVYINWVISSTF